MSAELRECSGYLLVALSEAQLARVAELAEASGLMVDVSSRSIEFGYKGRDTGCAVEKFLGRLAAIIGTADGEIECRNIDDELNDRFDYYAVRAGRLYRQSATIVRGAPAEVGDDD